MKKPVLISSMHNLLLNEEFDIKHKLQNMMLTIALAGSSLLTIKSFILDYSIFRSVISLFTTLTVFFAFFFSVILRKKKAASYIACIVIDLILFPLLFVSSGGIYSSIPLWLVFGLTFPWFILDGAGCIVMFVLELLTEVGCFAVQVYFPELIFVPVVEDPTLSITLDMAVAVAVISAILGLTIKYQVYAFEQQQRKLELQGEKLRQAMKLADQSNEAKTAYLVSMSHEIRTPINAVLGMDEMILRESSDETILSYAENIQSAGQSLLSVINDVLDFSKIESGKLELLQAEYDVQQLMNDCYSMMIMRAEKKNLLLEIHNDPKLPSRLVGDEVRIKQIILNLLTNAVKYTSAGSVTLGLGFYEAGENRIILRITVHDTGMGISPDNQKILFTAFSRLDEIHNRKIEGTGLGLSITKRITDLMGGSIGVKSSLGSGSEFWVELPQTVSSTKPVGVFIENRRAMRGQKREYHERFHAPAARILVVDDVKLNIDVIKGLLKNTRVRIDCAYSGRECLGLARKNSYDLIFMDHLMPEMDGIETLNTMRQLPESPNRDTPVIVLTANALVGAREKYAELGFTDYLAKPVQSDKLELMLLEYLPPELICPESAEPSEQKPEREVRLDLSQLDIARGTSWCCGDGEFYRKILGMLDLVRITDELDASFRTSDWKSYERVCCGLKSSARTVGAEMLSQLAAEMEQQAGSGGISYIRENHSRLIECCQGLDRTVSEYLEHNITEGEKY